MCGINGWINYQNKIEEAVFNQMRDTLIHRGPDGEGSFFSPNGQVAIGHRRLSFLDLSHRGAQPMTNAKRNLWIALNGEIYNYLELKKELESSGYSFNTTTDTEVVLNAYEAWGTDCLQRFKGMFAFSIWDEKKQALFLARDRFGIKPLYYLDRQDMFCFGSELKAIHACPSAKLEVDYSAVADYLTYRFVPSPKTIWKGVKKLPAAHFLFHEKGKTRLVEYWKLNPGNKVVPAKEAIAKVGHFLEESVKIHTRSDVPIGSFLSGGYDSSALVYLLKKMNYQANTFSIGFENWEASEHQYAQLVANTFEQKHYTTIVGNEQLDLVEKLAYHYDEPIGDISIIPTYMVSQLARKHNKAVLSGEGADELLVGYSWQKDIANFSKINAWKSWLKHKIKGPKNSFFVEKYAEAMAMGRYSNHNLPQLLHPSIANEIPANSEWFYKSLYQPMLSPLKSFQYMDVKAFMGELVLTKIDRASMANSLEVRVPFLDHEMYEYLYGLNEKVYFQKDVTKLMLRENIKSVMPKQILDRPKQGFVGPDLYYMNIDWYARQLRGGHLIEKEIIQPKALEQLIMEKSHWQLWKLVVLEMWFRKWQ